MVQVRDTLDFGALPAQVKHRTYPVLGLWHEPDKDDEDCSIVKVCRTRAVSGGLGGLRPATKEEPDDDAQHDDEEIEITGGDTAGELEEGGASPTRPGSPGRPTGEAARAALRSSPRKAAEKARPKRPRRA